MSHLIRASAAFAAGARRLWVALSDVRCTQACQVDRELMSLQTSLTRQSGWSASGIQ